MTEPDNGDRLREIEARIARLKGEATDKAEPTTGDHYSQGQVAWRMVTELVAGLGIGFGIGLGLDAVFGTRPFLMVLFIFLGLAAGIKTMMRTAAEVGRQQAGEPADRQGDA